MQAAPGHAAKLGARPGKHGLTEGQFAWLLIAPGLVLMVVLSTLPLVMLVGQSLFTIDLTSPMGNGWAGLRNYTRLLADSRFWHAMQITAFYTVGTVALQLVIGMGLALMLFRPFRGQNLVRVLLLLPTILSPVVVGLLWRTLLLTPRFGLIDYLSESLGLGSHRWLGDPTLALISVTVIHTWQWTPFAFLVFLATLHALPQEPLEAAKLDCRSWWQQFRYVILPLMRPAIVIVIILRTIVALNAFGAIYAATGGGPGLATQILNLYAYEAAFVNLSIGYGSALGTTQLLLTAAIALIFFRIRMARS